MKEIKFRLILGVFLIAQKFGTYDRDLLNWLDPLIKKFSDTDLKQKLLKTIEALLKLNDEQLYALSQQRKAQTKALSLKTFSLPFLDSKISTLSLFDTKFQNTILEIRSQVNLLSEEIEQARFFYEKTFDSTLNQENHAIISQNLRDSYQHIANVSRRIVDRISNI